MTDKILNHTLTKLKPEFWLTKKLFLNCFPMLHQKPENIFLICIFSAKQQSLILYEFSILFHFRYYLLLQQE